MFKNTRIVYNFTRLSRSTVYLKCLDAFFGVTLLPFLALGSPWPLTYIFPWFATPQLLHFSWAPKLIILQSQIYKDNCLVCHVRTRASFWTVAFPFYIIEFLIRRSCLESGVEDLLKHKTISCRSMWSIIFSIVLLTCPGMLYLRCPIFL